VQFVLKRSFHFWVRHNIRRSGGKKQSPTPIFYQFFSISIKAFIEQRPTKSKYIQKSKYI
jgi:hypothetical protein